MKDKEKKQRVKRERRERHHRGPRGIFGFVLAGLSCACSITLITLMSLIATDYINLIPEYVTVTFKNYDGTILEKRTVLEFESIDPVPMPKPKEGSVFLFWNKDLRKVWFNMTTKPVFLSIDKALELWNAGMLPEGIDIDFDALAKQKVMTLKSEKPGVFYLRQQNFGDYNSGQWSSAPAYSGRYAESTDKTFTNPFNFAGVVGAPNYHPSRLDIKYETSFDKYPVPQYSSETNFNSSNDSYVGVPKLDDNNVYHTDSYYADPSMLPALINGFKNAQVSATYKKQIDTYKRFARDNYLNINKDMKKVVKDIIREDGLESSDSNIFKKVVDSIFKRGKVKLDSLGNPKKGVDPINDFLESKVCSRTTAASLATLIFRGLGMPARYTTGYIAGSIDGKETSVSPLQVTPWCEVFVDKVGWILVDPNGRQLVEYLKNNNEMPPINGGDTLPSHEGNVEARIYEKVYDGEPCDTNNIFALKQETIDYLERNKLEIEFYNSMAEEFVNVGTRVFKFNYRLIKNDRDVTIQYNGFKLDLPPVLVTIKKRPITVRFKDQEYEYSKDHGYSYSIEYEVDNLLPSHSLSYDNYNEQFNEPGEYEILGDPKYVTIIDLNSGYYYEVTNNYKITFVPGMLTIY